MLKMDALAPSLILFLGWQNVAHAYIDPGSGSIMTSAIIGFFAAIAYTFRKTFYRIKDKLVGRSRSSTKEADKDDF